MSTLLKILGGLGVLLLGFVLLLFVTLRTKVEDVSDQSPYVELLNRDLVVARDVPLGMNREPDTYQRRVFVAPDFSFTEEVPQIAMIPAGTTFRFTGAKTFRNGTSGFTWRILLGTVTNPADGKTYEFEFNWGAEQSEPTPAFWDE